MSEFETRVREIDWSVYLGPELYKPEAIPKALLGLKRLNDSKNAELVYNQTLGAIGNNHRGTYYPAVLAALEFVSEISKDQTARQAAKVAEEILIDLADSFSPELGGYSAHTEQQIEQFVRSFSAGVTRGV